MKKIPTLFIRDQQTHHLIDVVTPGYEWVIAGYGVATRKWDGTAILIEAGVVYRRYEVRPPKSSPAGFIHAQAPDPITGRQPGWLPVTDGPDDRWCHEALATARHHQTVLYDGTYELIGPKINGNPEHRSAHELIPHGNEILDACPRTFEDLKMFLFAYPVEGIVWWHPDGRRAKIKRRDFGWPWPIPVTKV